MPLKSKPLSQPATTTEESVPRRFAKAVHFADDHLPDDPLVSVR